MALPWPPAQARSDSIAEPRALRFPRDNGTHNDAKTEWWYLTGYATGTDGNTYGFQVTFFRSRVDGTQALQSRLAAKHLLFAHAAIADVKGQQLWHDQRIARWNGEATASQPGFDSPGAAFAQANDTGVALRGWSLRRLPDGRYQARVNASDFQIELNALPMQSHLLQGQNGFSRKGPEPAQSSFYVSQPQLGVSGRLTVKGKPIAIQQGRAWLDHEWSESLLHPDAVGWDWIGMNLDNGDSLTAFRLRRADGTSLWAGGSWRSAAQRDAPLGAQIFNHDAVLFEPLRHWTSPLTRARYPVAWRVTSPAGVFTVQALVDAQELDSRQSTGTVYWEGLSDLLDAQAKRVGRGYLEMTGYAQRLVL
ncbi:hydrolase [Hydrogenophaga crassostreae]|uniref:Hydrolase n=2 Tax=Hydrogenophaga crassostreae TaxID=1763535 RepID=A0ABX2U478_9BURK|nr:carotenoid 1,2-hydratase [Hydrogenophaga crassostreae]OAD40617.1 hydrolase [Hydrogenophaga crassostreae]